MKLEERVNKFFLLSRGKVLVSACDSEVVETSMIFPASLRDEWISPFISTEQSKPIFLLHSYNDE